MPVEIFRHEDERYEAWLRSHRRAGFVVNARQRITPDYLKLHTVWCDHINTLRPGYTTWTCGAYVKVCSTSRAALERWAADDIGGELEDGCYCLSA